MRIIAVTIEFKRLCAWNCSGFQGSSTLVKSECEMQCKTFPLMLVSHFLSLSVNEPVKSGYWHFCLLLYFSEFYFWCYVSV